MPTPLQGIQVPCSTQDNLFSPPPTPNTYCSSMRFYSYHQGGGNFLAADGSVHFAPYSVATTPISTGSSIYILDALVTINGEEVFTVNF
jgi:prepilin-type processing-associated H-X9-DG protein